MIEKASFTNFKCFREMKIQLGRLTGIVGPNGSGKTTILEGLEYLGASEPRTLISLLVRKSESRFLINRASKSPMVVAGYEGERGVRFTCLERDKHEADKAGGHAQPSRVLDLWNIERIDPKNYIEDWEKVLSADFESGLGPSVRLSLNASLLASPSINKSPKPRLRRGGRNLASTLAYMASNRPVEFGKLQEKFRALIPMVEHVRLDQVATERLETETIRVDDESILRHKKRGYVGDTIIFDMKGAPNLPAQFVSEGTLLVLGLLTALSDLDRSAILLLDDLDHGLHPRAQRDLVGLLRKFLEENPETQIVFTTHSPYLLDCLEPEEVRLTSLNDDGSASCASLVDHPDFDRWKDEMSPGEMWSLFGEKWVGSQHV